MNLSEDNFKKYSDWTSKMPPLTLNDVLDYNLNDTVEFKCVSAIQCEGREARVETKLLCMWARLGEEVQAEGALHKVSRLESSAFPYSSGIWILRCVLWSSKYDSLLPRTLHSRLNLRSRLVLGYARTTTPKLLIQTAKNGNQSCVLYFQKRLESVWILNFSWMLLLTQYTSTA